MSTMLHKEGLKNLENNLIDDNELELYSGKTIHINSDNVYDDNTGTIDAFSKAQLDYDDSKSESANEQKNVRILYDAVKDDMSVGKAYNRMLWATLCHTVCFNYIKKRNKGGRHTVDINKRIKDADLTDSKQKKKITALITKNFFITTASYRQLERNHIAKLWLVADKTYRCWERFPGLEKLKQDDSYYYTDIALYSMDVFQAVFERNDKIAKHPQILNGILYYFSLNPSALTKKSARKWYQTFIKEIVCRLVVNPVYLNFSLDSFMEFLEEIAEDISI